MVESRGTAVGQRYRNAFLAGVAALLPTLLTVYVLTATYSFIEARIARPLNAAIVSQLQSTPTLREQAVRLLDLDPELLRPEFREQFSAAVTETFPAWIGLIAAVVLCFAVGFFIASFLGKKLWALTEYWLMRIPIVRAVYPSAKQLTSFFIQPEDGDNKQFSRVCLVPFPNSQTWSIGFVTSSGMRMVDSELGGRHLVIFVPMAPTPVTGFVVMMPEASVLPLDMSVDEAFKLYLTAGVTIPPAQALEVPASMSVGADSTDASAQTEG